MNDLLKNLVGQLSSADGGSKAVAALVGLAVLVAIGVTAVVSNKPDYQSAFTNLSVREHAAVSKALSEAGIGFRVSQPPGPFTVFVDEGDRSAALAAAYSSGALDQPLKGILTDPGVSSVFMGNAERTQLVEKRHWEDIEGMLETLDSVVSAKVRAAPVEHKPFSSRAEDKASASVTLTMFGNRELTRSEAKTIARLVSSALGVDVKNLTITDQSGNRPYVPGEESEEPTSQSLLTTKLEYDQHTAENVNRILLDILGPDKARVTVSSEWDFEQSTTRTESANGKGGLVSKSKTSKETPLPVSEAPARAQDDSGDLLDPSSDEPAPVEVPRLAKTEEEREEYQPTITTTQSVRAHEVLKRQSVALYLDESIQGELLASLASTIKASVSYVEGRDDFSSTSLAFYVPPEVEPEEAAASATEEEGGGGSGLPVEMLMRRGVEIVTALVFIFLLLKSLKSGSGAKTAQAVARGETGSSTEAEIDPELLARAQVEELLQADPEKVGRILSSWARGEESTVGTRS